MGKKFSLDILAGEEPLVISEDDLDPQSIRILEEVEQVTDPELRAVALGVIRTLLIERLKRELAEALAWSDDAEVTRLLKKLELLMKGA